MTMKKILLAAMAAFILSACSGERGYLDYRGLSMGMPASKMVDSLQQQGLALDTTKYADRFVLADTVKGNFKVAVYHQNDTITDILENYTASYNDSTTNLWQARRDSLEKEFGWPNMGKHGDLHKEATFENEKGTVLLILLNTYSPTVTIRYSTATTQL